MCSACSDEIKLVRLTVFVEVPIVRIIVGLCFVVVAIFKCRIVFTVNDVKGICRQVILVMNQSRPRERYEKYNVLSHRLWNCPMVAANVLQAGAEAANMRLGRAAFALACCYNQ